MLRKHQTTSPVTLVDIAAYLTYQWRDEGKYFYFFFFKYYVLYRSKVIIFTQIKVGGVGLGGGEQSAEAVIYLAVS